MRQRKPKMSTGKKVAIVLLLLVAALMGALVGTAAHYPEQTMHVVRQALSLDAGESASGQEDSQAEGEEAEAGAADADADGSEAGFEGDDAASNADAGNAASASSSAAADASASSAANEGAGALPEVPTRQVAAYGKLPIYSPIAQKDLTGVLFHQASYDTALVMTTKLPDANVEKVSVDHPVRVNNAQTEGDWVDADALHLYRETDITEMDTSIDMGAPAGTTVYAPMTGTVLLVKKYDLYGEVPDIQIHIQPDGHPELDLVLLHQYDAQVKAGDHVEGGVTPLSRVRDIAKDLTDIQLGFYTAADDPGNHSHVQLNNADKPGYREDSLKGAYKVKSEKSS